VKRETQSSIEESPLELERFRVRAARAFALTPDDAAGFDRFCAERKCELLVVRCPTTQMNTVQAFEDGGARMMDCLVYYQRDLRKNPLSEPDTLDWIRAVVPSEVPAVATVAATAFEGYFGHYHADERLDRSAADETYRDWAVRSCGDPVFADRVYAAWDGDDVVGFATLKRNSPEEGEAVLFGVAPRAQGRGIYNALIVKALHWAVEIGASRCTLSTQISNVAVQKVWVRNGFEPMISYFTLHKWYGR